MVSSKTADFVSHNHGLYIDGKFVPAASGKTFPVYNPATGDVIAHVPEADRKTSISPCRRAARLRRRQMDPPCTL